MLQSSFYRLRRFLLRFSTGVVHSFPGFLWCSLRRKLCLWFSCLFFIGCEGWNYLLNYWSCQTSLGSVTRKKGVYLTRFLETRILQRLDCMDVSSDLFKLFSFLTRQPKRSLICWKCTLSRNYQWIFLPIMFWPWNEDNILSNCYLKMYDWHYFDTTFASRMWKYHDSFHVCQTSLSHQLWTLLFCVNSACQNILCRTFQIPF